MIDYQGLLALSEKASGLPYTRGWDPLLNNADADTLVEKYGMSVELLDERIVITVGRDLAVSKVEERFASQIDAAAARRRAIVRAASYSVPAWHLVVYQGAAAVKQELTQDERLDAEKDTPDVCTGAKHEPQQQTPRKRMLT
ncbi:hypothetical protein [Burkholderia vietnamiensis]|uniref:hypothetical protein n=1 Tax=Burkholderia vietnamiensis TaxID=60552 RepID=UPI00075840AF|nr:hypothetical protein [Burkholderia vietnamiensis]KVF93535.1 hypothetical protein WJ21_26960 [Burkholderia vietnamiensis]